MSKTLEERRAFVREALERGRQEGATAVLVNCGYDNSRSVSFSAGRLKECSRKCTEMFSISLVAGGRMGMAAGNDWDALPSLVKRAAAFARNGAAAHFEKYPAPAAAYPELELDSDSVEKLTEEVLIADCGRIVSSLRELDDGLVVDAGGNVSRGLSITATDAGFWREEKRSLWSLGAGYQKTTGTDMLFSGAQRAWGEWNDFYSPDRLLEELAFDLRHGAQSVPVENGPVTLILPPEQMTLFLKPLALAINGRNVFKGTSPLKDKLGRLCFAQNLSVYDNPHIRFSPSACAADDCGVPTAARHLVKEGVLECFLYDYDTAGLAGAQPTGNIDCSPYTMLVQPGTKSHEELLRGVARGVYVRDFLGFGQSNMTNGDFSANLALAFWVENGEITHRVKNAMVAGNLFELLRGEVAFSSDTHPWNRQPFGFIPNVSLKC